MSRYLCTFSGQYGDALWSLATVRAIKQIVGEPVDFAIMQQYNSVLDIIKLQPYIDRAFGVKDWLQVHNNHGAQPWHPPVALEKNYERSWHLGYRGHPGLNDVALPLIDYVAHQQGIKLRDPLPFIELVPEMKQYGNKPVVSYAFNEQYKETKERFLTALKQMSDLEFEFVDVGNYEWSKAAAIIKSSVGFVGCRSANWVIAMGLKKRSITFEPHPMRHQNSRLGLVFSCPYGEEVALPFNAPPEVAASIAKSHMVNWRVTDEVPQTVAG